jgi:tRNA 2-selenouridine synthase
VLSGSTGSGKTEVLQALGDLGEQIIDLEALANHKGSVFGGLGKGPQPTTEQFQNDLFEALLHLDRTHRIWVEDESKGIGHLFQPEPFWAQKVASPVVALQVDKSTRIQRLVREYGDCNSDEFIQAMEKIEKRLGGQHLIEARERWRAGDKAGTMEKLLTYYDKTYAASLGKKKEQVLGVVPWNGLSAMEAAKSVLAVADAVKVYL